MQTATKPEGKTRERRVRIWLEYNHTDASHIGTLPPDPTRNKVYRRVGKVQRHGGLPGGEREGKGYRRCYSSRGWTIIGMVAYQGAGQEAVK